MNWVDETFRNNGSLNKYTAEFRGGTDKFRYYAMANLLTQGGFIKNPNSNEGYSTQDKFSRGNVRMNLDIRAHTDHTTRGQRVWLAERVTAARQPG